MIAGGGAPVPAVTALRAMASSLQRQMTTSPDTSTLVADIGGTNARFARAIGSEISEVTQLSCADFDSLTAAARAYLRRVGGSPPRRAAIAVAGPVHGDTVRMTNHVWSISRAAVRKDLGLDRLEMLNDFAALALAVPVLTDADLREIKPGRPVESAPKAVMGPGTGLGVAALVPTGSGWSALTTEGGHRDLAAQTEREWQIVRHLRERFQHVSAERVLSGPGLVNLYEAICRLADSEPQGLSPAAVVAGAREGSSAACIEATQLFSTWLGAVASDLALTLGAFGGIYLGGGVLPKMGEVFDVDRFRERFLAKGRFREYLRQIPVAVITRPHATLLGAARALEDRTGGGPAARGEEHEAEPHAG